MQMFDKINKNRVFRNREILSQMKIIAPATLVLFGALCGLTSELTRQMVFKNEDEYMQIAFTRIRDRINLSYERIENFYINREQKTARQHKNWRAVLRSL